MTIGGAPYVCDLDGKRFKDGDAFVVHLVSAHRIPADRIPDRVVVRGGDVHFVAE